MMRLLIVIAAIALIGTPAFALNKVAKKPVKVRQPPPAQVNTWTGWYVGGNVGYGRGNAKSNVAGGGSTTTFAGVSPGFPGFVNSFGFGDSNTVRPSGVIGGGQVGYNYQFSPKWVWGFEADIQGSGQRGSGGLVDQSSVFACTQVGLLPGVTCATRPPLCFSQHNFGDRV
jgi:outer membrane immunogenic protein